ncbi:hypothetical protein CPB84DRAFT_726744 [Gymnopilus junonius]|uniref:Extracellular mutant protein 11 C-terminal domain-containing protein n=1 Tax=Gymnopilus junonius TaxID=109634 RepID=A0A9P5TP04_GYMJU|nr:hypothetical protein CPB84DRAFT_726744 [Gymnopilus junonius]
MNNREIAQPTPQPAARPASALLSVKPRSSLNSNPFKVPGTASSANPSSVTASTAALGPSFSEKNTHISTSDSDAGPALNKTANSNNENEFETPSINSNSLPDTPTNGSYIQASALTLQSNASANQIGPRRIFVEAGSALYGDGQRGPSAHEVTENGGVKWNSLSRKRTIAEVEETENEYRYDNHPKRLKTIPDTMSNENRGLPGRNSPVEDRPSSGLSHSTDRRTANSQVRESPNSHRRPRAQSRQAPREEYPPYETPVAQQPRQHSVAALDDLLGQDTDAFVREHMDIYDQLVQKWSNCSLTEWLAGSDEIASQYCKILDDAKEYVTDKVKLYGSFHVDIDNHNVLLDERSRELVAAKKKLVQESGSFLGN